jgi:hypothetical protein
MFGRDDKLSVIYKSVVEIRINTLQGKTCHTRFLRPKLDAHRMYAQDQVVIHTVRM